MDNYDDIVRRLLFATQSDTKTELAEKLGYNSISGLTNWKGRGVDWNRIHTHFPTLNVEWVKTGRGVMRSDGSLPDAPKEVLRAPQLGHGEVSRLSQDHARELLTQIELIVKILKDSL